jgi:nitroimidazol reductase NimA-like FMN-containing flavoprotein (pyridoxamine 5'-phosphate oxidase superfamily)
MLVKEMTLEECYRALKSTRLGRLGCAHADQPYVVPIFFAYDGAHLYSSNIYCFSTIGLKIEWMRTNPLVCLEIDDVKNASDWMSVVVLGHYQELLDTAEYQVTRRHAYDLLSERALWWEPAAVPGGHGDHEQSFSLIYRIFIDHLSGRRGVAEPGEKQKNFQR